MSTPSLVLARTHTRRRATNRDTISPTKATTNEYSTIFCPGSWRTSIPTYRLYPMNSMVPLPSGRVAVRCCASSTIPFWFAMLFKAVSLEVSSTYTFCGWPEFKPKSPE